MATYVDGALQTSTTSSDSLAGSSNKNSVVDSDTFLTLLVAEMQNQDPLEPTSNTEWVSQYATFTQVEQMSEMSDSMDLMRANSLVGKEVIMKVTSVSTGETNYVRGTVDYVTVESGEAYLVIDEQKYSMADLDTVASDEYFTAYDLYTEFTGMIDALPTLNAIDKSYENTVGKIYDLYNNLTEYQKNYIDKYASGYVSSYEAYIDKMKQIGITYGETTEETIEEVSTLDDVLDAFNEKMDALMSQISTLGNSIQSNVAGKLTSSGSSSETVGPTQTSGESVAGSTIDEIQSNGEIKAGETTDETQPSGGVQADSATDGTQPSDGIEAGETTDGALSNGGTEAGEATDETQPSGGTETGETTDKTQPSGGTEAGETTDETQSSDGTEAGGASDTVQAAEQTGSSETGSSEDDATDDMLDQLTQDAENA